MTEAISCLESWPNLVRKTFANRITMASATRQEKMTDDRGHQTSEELLYTIYMAQGGCDYVAIFPIS